MTNKEIAIAFANGKTRGQANSMYIYETMSGRTIIYSYGAHYPIAIKSIGIVYFNSDKYSRTTSKQQTIVLRELEAKNHLIAYKTTEELQALISHY